MAMKKGILLEQSQHNGHKFALHDASRKAFIPTKSPQPTTNNQENPSSTMCYHKRIVYTCGHFGWADEVRPCDAQKGFLNGSQKSECEVMYSHPLQTIRVQANCKDCAAKQKKTDTTMSSVKDKLRALTESVARLQKTEEKEAEAEDEPELDLDAEAEAETLAFLHIPRAV